MTFIMSHKTKNYLTTATVPDFGTFWCPHFVPKLCVNITYSEDKTEEPIETFIRHCDITVLCFG